MIDFSEPTGETPFAFYQNLIEFGGLEEMLIDFIPNPDYDSCFWDEINLTKSYILHDKETGDEEHIQKTFNDHVYSKLKEQNKLSKQHFAHHIDLLDKREALDYVEKCIKKLSVLLVNCEKVPLCKKSDCIPKSLIILQSYILEWKLNFLDSDLKDKIPIDQIADVVSKKNNIEGSQNVDPSELDYVEDILMHLNGKNQYRESILTGIKESTI